MSTWIEVLNVAAMVASVLSFFSGVYTLWKKKSVTGLWFIVLFFVAILSLLFVQRSQPGMTIQGQHLQDGNSVVSKEAVPSQIVNTHTATGSSAQLRDVADHLKDLEVRAVETQKRWQPTIERLNSLNQPMRADISDALVRLRSHIELAQKALADKDSGRTTKNINLAERQMTFLERQNPQ
jgi:hypothetical protein